MPYGFRVARDEGEEERRRRKNVYLISFIESLDNKPRSLTVLVGREATKAIRNLFRLSRAAHTTVFTDFSARCFIKINDWLTFRPASLLQSQDIMQMIIIMQISNQMYYSCTLFIG